MSAKHRAGIEDSASRGPTEKRSIPWLGSALLLLATLLCLDVAALVVGRYLETKGVYYAPPEKPVYWRYLARRDPVLGWPSPSTFGGKRRTPSGARRDPVFPDSLAPCVALYGDSFTWASEVDDADAWSSVLGRLLDCRVANYGVGGYGSDQAYLRYLQHEQQRPNETARAPVVVLNHLSENILRNVTQYFGMLYHGHEHGFKPRFVLGENGTLTLAPLPTFSRQAYLAAVDRPEDVFPDDHFAPGGPGGVTRLRFPYLLSILKAFRHYHVRAALTRTPRYEPFYDPGHEAEGLQLTSAILSAFVADVTGNGASALVTLLPTGEDLLAYQARQRWPYQPLLDTLEARGLPVLNVGSGLMEHLRGEDPCLLFDSCGGHYNERGYEAIAQIVHAHLQETLPSVRALPDR